jgi:response regulator RpfG family c-di-GMP phosphodiesterase
VNPERAARRPILLMVDDEVRILAALRRSLRREGYEILTAETPAEAIRLLDQHSVDLILSDQKMPGMSGMALLAEAAQRQPEAVRLLITGWTENVPPDDLKALDVRALVPKPWQDAQLKQLLRDALAGR